MREAVSKFVVFRPPSPRFWEAIYVVIRQALLRCWGRCVYAIGTAGAADFDEGRGPKACPADHAGGGLKLEETVNCQKLCVVACKNAVGGERGIGGGLACTSARRLNGVSCVAGPIVNLPNPLCVLRLIQPPCGIVLLPPLGGDLP